jgi:hypothetical protein
MADQQKETGLLKLVTTVTEQQKREHIAADERKRHAARTNEMLKNRFGVPDDHDE